MSDELRPSGASPLTEADPNSINILIAERLTDIMNKPPLLVSDADLAAMVEYYQAERVRFKAESQQKEARPRGASRKKPESVAEALDMNVATVDML